MAIEPVLEISVTVTSAAFAIAAYRALPLNRAAVVGIVAVPLSLFVSHYLWVWMADDPHIGPLYGLAIIVNAFLSLWVYYGTLLAATALAQARRPI